MRSFVIGIDIGGTNIKVGLVSRAGKVLDRTNLSTRSFVSSRSKLIEAVVVSVKELMRSHCLERKNVLAIGIGLPGFVDARRGIARSLVNIPTWNNVPLKSIFEKRLRIPTFLDNDVNLITLGEWKFGAGRGIQNLICITLGTGVGGGLILNNALFRGEDGTAGEIGHIPLNENGPSCNCGGYGCLERLVGNHYLLTKAKKVFRDSKISLEEITARAKRGDKRAVRFWEDVAVHLGNALAGVINLLNPRCLVIGGGVAGAHQFLFPKILSTIRKRAIFIPAQMLKIAKAQLGSDAGIIGAQVLVKNALQSR